MNYIGYHLEGEMRKLAQEIEALQLHIDSGLSQTGRKPVRTNKVRVSHGEQPVERKATIFYPPH